MKKLLLITFDFIRSDEPARTLSIGSLISRLKIDPRYGYDFIAEHISFNLYNRNGLKVEQILADITKNNMLSKLYAIVIGCYVWAYRFVNPLMSILRANGFNGKFILGGYEIVYPEQIIKDYPLADIFIIGYAEESLVQSLDITSNKEPVFFHNEPNLKILPSPYITGDINVEFGQGHVRIETKRGCLNNCSYCAHKGLQGGKIYEYELSRVYKELSFLKNLQVKKINIVDPTFNQGQTYRAVLHRCIEIGLKAKITLQVRFESIDGKEGDEFLDLCSSLDIVLEFGLQTIVENEMRQINRINNIDHAVKIMKILSQRDIPYEVSMIYGLPCQTLESFKESIAFLLDKGCTVVKSFPLKLLKGTLLWQERNTWGMIETPEGQFNIPIVTKSNSFSRDEWQKMRSMSKSVRRATQQMWKSSRAVTRKHLSPIRLK